FRPDDSLSPCPKNGDHLWQPQFERYFRGIKECLKPDGVALIHSIGRTDGPGTTNAWLQKYIFPGGYSPSLSETLAAVERTGLWMTDCEVLRLHYAKTIAEWRKRFEANRQKIIDLYDERFVRMFELYLVGSELAFRVQGHMNFQLQLTRSVDAVPLTRDYMFESERAKSAV
ncbi:class I SAM-dependent methyltransferase, partial [Gluconobacter cerinus]|uniref:class I SAM-dependent methyltransferase n=1 Tax=Gluconobacter cerinus TaxID=38307 RepID=UPI0039ED8EEC